MKWDVAVNAHIWFNGM